MAKVLRDNMEHRVVAPEFVGQFVDMHSSSVVRPTGVMQKIVQFAPVLVAHSARDLKTSFYSSPTPVVQVCRVVA